MKGLLRINNWLKKKETKDKSKWPLFTMRKVTSGIPQESVEICAAHLHETSGKGCE